MKVVRLFSVVIALVLFAGAVFPFAAQLDAAQTSRTIMVTSPAEVFMDAARGMPLLAPMSVTAPLITMSIESASSLGYACTLIKQNPKDYTKVKTHQFFDMHWNVQNNGSRTWYANWSSFKYIGGAKMQTRSDFFILPGDIKPGKKADLVVDMVTPQTQGIYSTTWGLYSGTLDFCRVTLTISVSR